MAELLKKKLSFPSTFVKLQALDQWVCTVRSRLKEGVKCSLELEILWRYCSESSHRHLGYACANALIKLAEDEILEIDDVITTAVNYSTTAKNAKILVYIVGHLLKFQAFLHVQKMPNNEYRCPYNFKTRPHPLISIVTTAANSRDVTDNEMANMILSCGESDLSMVLTTLRPAILHIALKGSNTSTSTLNANMKQPVPAVFKALFVKYTDLLTNSGKSCDMLRKLLGQILDYYEPNTENIKYFEEFAFSVNSTVFNTEFMLKLQHCVIRNSSLYEVYLSIRSIGRMLQYSVEAGINWGATATGFALVLGSVPLQILPSTLASVTEFLNLCRKKVLLVHLALLKASLLRLKFLTSAVSCSKDIPLLLEKILRMIANVENERKECDRHGSYSNESSSSSSFVLKAYQICYLISEVSAKKGSMSLWLDGIGRSAVEKDMDSRDVNDATLIVSSLFLYKLYDHSDSSDEAFSKILECMKKIGRYYPEVSYKLLPVLLCSLHAVDDNATVDVLLTIPALGSHPNCVAPVLNVIKGIGANSDCSLKGISLRMMVELWKVQDRVFPYLLDALYSSELQSVKKSSSSSDIKVLKAAAIAFVCKERPHQHGADMLKIIEAILNKQPSNEALAYILDGLYSLCVSAVLNVVTITERLIKIMESNDDLIVIRGILKTLALLSHYDVSEADSDSALVGVIISIWKLVCCGKSTSADEALFCLSHFDPQDFQVKHLPSKLWPTRLDDIEDEEFMEAIVPYSQYLAIARTVGCMGLPGCTKFLTNVLRNEIENMPRGIHHKAMKSQLAATQPKAAKSIPDFVATVYERNKKPGLKAPLALSMLLSQSSYEEGEIQSSSAKKLVVTAGRKSMDNIQAMLKEVTIEPKNWQDLLRCSQGWVAFMKKCLATMTTGRRVETEMQKFDDAEEKEHRINTAVLWCREKIVNVLKAASKNGPSMQGNAVLGLAGLLVAIEQYNKDEENIAEHTEYVSMSHFSVMALDTIISIAFPSHIASGRLLSWCQYRAISSTGKLCTSQVGRICAFHALPCCVSSAGRGRHNKVKAILRLFADDIFNDKQLNFHRKISLGNTLSVLTQEQVQSKSDVVVAEMSLETSYQNMLEQVEDLVIRGSDSLEMGSLIGWGLAATLRLSQSSLVCEREKSVWNNILEVLKTSDVSPDTSQTISLVLTWLCLHGCVRGVMSSTDAKELLNVLVDAVDEMSAKSGLSDALGTLCCGMLLNGNKDATAVVDRFFTHWFGMLEKGNMPTREKLAALTGLSSLCGASASIFSMPVDPAMLTAAQYVSKLSGTVKVLKQLFASNDAGMQSRSPIYLGGLNMFFENSVHNSAFVLPSTYDYLSKHSLLTGMFKIISDLSASDAGSRHFEGSLKSIAESSYDLIMPPVNWSNALNVVLMNSSSSVSAKKLSMDVVLAQCDRSPACSDLLLKCISSGAFHQLPMDARNMICKGLNKVFKAAKEQDFIYFLDMMVQKFLNKSDASLPSGLKSGFMIGLEDFLRNNVTLSHSVLDPVKASLKKIFFETSFSVYSNEDLAVTRLLAACCKFVDIPSFKNAEVGMTSSVLLRSLYFSCCQSLNRSKMSNLDSKLILACGGHPDIHGEASWVIATYALQMRALVQLSTLTEWLRELMKITEHCSESNTDVDERCSYFVTLIVSLLMSIYFRKNSPDLGHFEVGRVRPEQIEFFKTFCQRSFPIVVHSSLRQSSSPDISDSISSWSKVMIERLRECNSSTKWLYTLESAVGVFKDIDASLMPSTWHHIVSILYPD